MTKMLKWSLSFGKLSKELISFALQTFLFSYIKSLLQTSSSMFFINSYQSGLRNLSLGWTVINTIDSTIDWLKNEANCQALFKNVSRLCKSGMVFFLTLFAFWVVMNLAPSAVYFRHGFRSESQDVKANRVNWVAIWLNLSQLHCINVSLIFHNHKGD